MFVSSNLGVSWRTAKAVVRAGIGEVSSMLRSRSRCILCCLLLLLPTCLEAATVSGTLKDSTGAIIIGGKVEIRGGKLLQAITVSSDSLGHFNIPDLKPGSYSLRATSTGFEAL